MSTTIRATCDACGDVKFGADRFTIRTRQGVAGGQYRFLCSCGKIVVKDASEPIIQLLRDAYVKEEIWELPLELIEHPQDGTLAEDDLIDLALAFEDGSAFDKITKKKTGEG